MFIAQIIIFFPWFRLSWIEGRSHYLPLHPMMSPPSSNSFAGSFPIHYSPLSSMEPCWKPRRWPSCRTGWQPFSYSPAYFQPEILPVCTICLTSFAKFHRGRNEYQQGGSIGPLERQKMLSLKKKKKYLAVYSEPWTKWWWKTKSRQNHQVLRNREVNIFKLIVLNGLLSNSKLRI